MELPNVLLMLHDKIFEDISNLNNESVITINGKVIKRSDETINKSTIQQEK